MKETRLPLLFLSTSIAAFCALCYFDIQYESGLLYFANLLTQHNNPGTRFLHADNQLYLIAFQQEFPAVLNIEGLHWIWAGQATVIGTVLSSYTSTARKLIWLIGGVLVLAAIHVILLVFVSSELFRHYFGRSGPLAAYGAAAFKLYRIGMPLVLLCIWILCSHQTLFVQCYIPHSAPSNPTVGSRHSDGKKIITIDVPQMQHGVPSAILWRSHKTGRSVIKQTHPLLASAHFQTAAIRNHLLRNGI